MKSFDAPSSVSATHTTAVEDSSPTSMLPALGPDSIATLSDTETLRVLEVRRPTQNVESADERDTYAVRVEERFQAPQRAQQQRPALSLVPSVPRILPPPGAAPAAPPAHAVAPATKPAAPVVAKPAPPPTRKLTDELDKLTKKEYAPSLVDLSSTTGVRHLRIELANKRGKPGKKR